MDWLYIPLSDTLLTNMETSISDWVFIAALAFFGFEFVRYGILKKLSWNLVGDSITNYITLIASVVGGALILGTLYVGSLYFLYQNAVFEIETTVVTALICLVLADLAYYWEHRFSHRVNLAWATHTVHHSSPHFNISVANRFGPMDTFWAIPFHLPLAFVGFNPILILVAEIIVLEYQTFLHTESVKKLPRPVEWLMNTPSHHRVHHGANDQYIDKNYAGMFIIWDRLFGTFADEKEPVVYGLKNPLNSINPFTVFFHGFMRLGRKIAQSRGPSDVIAALLAPPEWHPKSKKGTSHAVHSQNAV